MYVNSNFLLNFSMYCELEIYLNNLDHHLLQSVLEVGIILNILDFFTLTLSKIILNDMISNLN